MVCWEYQLPEADLLTDPCLVLLEVRFNLLELFRNKPQSAKQELNGMGNPQITVVLLVWKNILS
jgi:hypothetical protein